MLGGEQEVDGSGNNRREGAADSDREAVHACGGLGVRLEGWVEGQEVRGDGLFAVEEGGSLLRRVRRLNHGQRRSHDDRQGRSTSGPGGPSGSEEEESQTPVVFTL